MKKNTDKKTIKPEIDENIDNNKEDKKKPEPEQNINEIFKISTIENPIWLSVSEASKLGGVQSKTIRRAIQAHKVTYKIYKNKYLIDFASLIAFLFHTKKLKNKLKTSGIGQYINKWAP